MALTKVSTDGVKDDAITSGKIPANAVGASELADNAVDTNAIANNAVTAGKTSGVSTTINNNADNRVITGSGTANTLNGESNVVIDSSGRLLVGTTSILHSQNNKLNVAGTDASTALSLNRYSDNALASYIYFRKSRSGTVGGNTIVQNNDLLGRIYFEGNDGSSPVSAAFIEAHVDGTPGNQDMPGRLEFLTAADGTPTPVERMRIDSSGNVGIGNNNPDQKLKIQDSNDVAIHILKTGSQDTLIKNTGQTEICAASGGASGQRIAFKIGANTGSLSDIAKFTDSGLCFGSDTAAANALDDYEEGTFTPTQPTVGFNSASGHYTKIGRQVTVSIFCTLPTNSSGQAFVIDSMPFTSKSNSGTYIQGGYVMYTQYTSQALKVLIHDNSTRMQVYSGAGTDIALTNLDNQNFRIQLHYTVS